MPFNIDRFRADGLKVGGARPSQFEVIISPPAGLTSQASRITMLCKATQIPPMVIGETSVSYFGRPVKFAGDREFPPWSVTCYNDEDYEIRSIMEKWNNEINKLVSNINGDSIWPLNYKSDAEVFHYGKNGDIIRSYKFVGLWPQQIDAMALDWDATNQMQMFDVTFAYDYWVPTSQDGPNGAPTSTVYSPTTPEDGN